jgi:N-acylglucosamine-6-phosphate 2-epimerase
MKSTVIDQIGERALIVSCQPVVGGPLDHDEFVVAMAKAAEIGGASALRIEGVRRVEAVKMAVRIPVIGIVKHDHGSIYISPFPEDFKALSKAGADIVAFDATLRERPVPVAELIRYGKTLDIALMADCASLEDANHAWEGGCEIVGSTLSGYLDGPAAIPLEPDFEMIREMAKRGMRVMAEGRIHTPDQARQALNEGAWAVTVGTALTRLELTTGWFKQALH